MAKLTTEPYLQQQDELLGMPLELLVPENHPVRIISAIVDSLDLSKVYASYKGGGASCFDPYMMLKIIIFGYMNNIYSGRQLAKVLKENIYFMWLANYSQPDFRTINMFRSVRLGDGAFDDIFTQVVLVLNEHGLVSLERQFVDGTK